MSRAVLACACLMLLSLASPAAAQNGKDRVVVTGPVSVARGELAQDVIVVDGDVNVGGRVTGDLVVVKGKVRIEGTVDGDVVALADQATLQPGARVGGDVAYGDEKPVVPAGATVSGEVQRVDVSKGAGSVGVATGIAAWLAISVSALLLGLLLLWLAPRAAVAAYETVEGRRGRSIVLGLVLFFALPILGVILLVTLVGLPLGVLVLLALVPLYSLAYTTSAWLLGRRIVGPPRGRFLAFIVGLVILRLLALIPVIGGLVWFVATVVGLGVLFLAAGRGRRTEAPATA